MPSTAHRWDDAVAVPEWLILGSFPFEQREIGHWQENGYEAETDFAPKPGDVFRGAMWTPCKPTGSGIVDFMHPAFAFKERLWCYAYAACYVRSPQPQTVSILIGSDDGYTVWANGKECGRFDMHRLLVPDEDRVPVRLRKGWNLLLIKVSQGLGSWAFQTRVGGKTSGAPRHPLTFATQRPVRGGFVGLRNRKRGVRIETVEAGPSLRRGELGIVATVKAFNDHASPAVDVAVELARESGDIVARGVLKAIEPFAVGECPVWIPLGSLDGEVVKGGGALRVVARANGSSDTKQVPFGAGADAFVGILGGFEIPVAGVATQRLNVPVPKAFRGLPLLVRVEPREPGKLTREVSHPELPETAIAGRRTNRASVDVDVEIPIGAGDVVARAWFGNKDQRATAERLRFLVRDVGAPLAGNGAAAAKGLAALGAGDFDGAIGAAARLADGIERELGSRRDQSVTLVGHAHLDMNWLWIEPETVQCAHDTFRQVLRFMDEFPDFHFSQSQASVYEMVERTDPELFAQVAERIREGRWEILGGAVDEGDTNLSSGEAIARTMLLGQRYFRSRFGKTASVGWLPDNFGHVAQLPQILNLSGVRYFFGHRCQPTAGPYWWESPDGSRLLAFATPTYNGEVAPDIRDTPKQYNPKQGISMAVYGVGDHGGGPTRRDVTRAIRYDEFRSFPRMRFGTAQRFYQSLEKGGDLFPKFRGEMQYVFEGCYTTIARVKEANRRGENLLYTAELIASLRSVATGEKYPEALFAKAWWIQAFNQFHDILCGSAIHDANREAIATYHQAQAPVEEWLGVAFRRYWADWGKSRPPKPVTDQGHPVMVFNPLPETRTDVAEVEIFTPVSPPTARIPHWGHFIPRPVEAVDVGHGPFASVRVEDDAGREVPGQVVSGKLHPNGYRARVQFRATEVPPTGVRGFRIFPDDPGPPESRLRVGRHWIETPRYRVEFDETTGHVRRIRDRKAKREVLKRGSRGNTLNMSMEAPHPMSAWDLGPVTRVDAVDDVQSAGIVEHGPVRAVYEVRRLWGRSEFTQRTVVYADADRIDFELNVRWYEVGSQEQDSPTLRVAFPVAVKNGRFVCDTPFAAVERPKTGREVPAQKWVDLSGGGYGVALLSDSKYGYRCTEDILEMTLIRAAYEPDICPDLGPHTIRYSLVPHRGSWKAGNVDRAGLGFNLPMTGAEAPTGSDIGKPRAGLALAPGNLFLSSWKRAEDGKGWIVRIFEGRGRAADAVLSFPSAIRSARRADLLENRLPEVSVPRVRGRTVRVRVDPHEIVSLRVVFGR